MDNSHAVMGWAYCSRNGLGRIKILKNAGPCQRGLDLKPLVAQKAVTLNLAVASRQPDPFFDRALPAFPGGRQGTPVVLEKILHHLALQNVLEDLRRDLPRNQTLF